MTTEAWHGRTDGPISRLSPSPFPIHGESLATRGISLRGIGTNAGGPCMIKARPYNSCPRQCSIGEDSGSRNFPIPSLMTGASTWHLQLRGLTPKQRFPLVGRVSCSSLQWASKIDARNDGQDARPTEEGIVSLHAITGSAKSDKNFVICYKSAHVKYSLETRRQSGRSKDLDDKGFSNTG
jgi:hypothetical protein